MSSGTMQKFTNGRLLYLMFYFFWKWFWNVYSGKRNTTTNSSNQNVIALRTTIPHILNMHLASVLPPTSGNYWILQVVSEKKKYKLSIDEYNDIPFYNNRKWILLTQKRVTTNSTTSIWPNHGMDPKKTCPMHILSY